jgi:hypothetical protein
VRTGEEEAVAPGGRSEEAEGEADEDNSSVAASVISRCITTPLGLSPAELAALFWLCDLLKAKPGSYGAMT